MPHSALTLSASLGALALLAGCAQSTSALPMDAALADAARDGADVGYTVLTPRDPDARPVCNADRVCWDTPAHGLAGQSMLRVFAPDDVWMVSTDGAVQHWDGHTRRLLFAAREPLGYVGLLWASGPQDLWLFGDGATHWDGHEWRHYAEPSVHCCSAWASGPRDVWALANARDAVNHWDGTRWELVALPMHTTPRVFAGRGPDDVRFGGWQGVVGHWDGARWNALPVVPGMADVLYLNLLPGGAVQVLAQTPGANHVFRWDGTRWNDTGEASYIPYWDALGVGWRASSGVVSRIEDGVTQQFIVDGLASAQAYDGDATGRPWMLDGMGGLWAPAMTSWQRVDPAAADPVLTELSVGPDGVPWGIANGPRVFERCGEGRWCAGEVVDPAVTRLESAWTSPEGGRWTNGVVNGTNYVLHKPPGGAWTRATSVYGEIRALHGSSERDVWVALSDNTAQHWNGTSWRVVPIPEGPVRALWSSSPTDAWLGQGSSIGTIAHWDGAGWTTVEWREGDAVNVFWGSGPQDVWAAWSPRTTPLRCALRHWDGVSWSDPDPCPVPGVYDVMALAGRSREDLWASADENLVHWDGTRWATVRGLTYAQPYQLTVTPDGTLYGLRYWGNVFTRRP